MRKSRFGTGSRPCAYLSMIILVVAAVSLVGLSADAWQVRFSGTRSDGRGADVRFDAAGDVVVAGTLDDFMVAAKIERHGEVAWKTDILLGGGAALAFSSSGGIAVGGASDAFSYGPPEYSSDVATARLDAAGNTISVYSTPLFGNHWVDAIVEDDSGEIVVAGSSGYYVAGANGYFSVLKPSGGSPWETTIAPDPVNGYFPQGRATAMVKTSDGQVVAAGYTHTLHEAINLEGEPSAALSHQDLVVAKIDPATGAIAWQTILAEPSAAYSVALDNAGDVVVVGNFSDNVAEHFSGVDLLVLKLDGDNGVEIWRNVIDTGGVKDVFYKVVIDANGDVIAGGRADSAMEGGPDLVELFGYTTAEFLVVKLNGDDGALVWSIQIPNDITESPDLIIPGVRGQVEALAVAPGGDVLATGMLNGTWLPAGPKATSDAAVARIDGDEGTLVWLHNFGSGRPYAIDVDANGTGVISGMSNWRHKEIFVAAFGVANAIGGQLIHLKEHDDPTERRLKLVAKSKISKVQEGSFSDPTLHGARLSVRDEASGDAMEIDLPSENWTARRSGYFYKDKGSSAGPCAVLRVTRSNIVAKCAGAGIDLLAGNAPLGTVTAKLQLGGELGTRYCIEFGGDVRKNDAKQYKAKKAPAPALCGADA